MRWPTIAEQGIGVLLLVFLATACMSALFVGLGSNWIVNVLLYSYDVYKKTIAVAIGKIDKLEAERERLRAELDETEAARRQATNERDEAQRERDQAQASLAATRKQLLDERKSWQDEVTQLKQARDMHGQRAKDAELELYHLKHPKSEGQGLVEYSLVLVLITVTVIGVLVLTGHTLDVSWYQLVIDRFPQ